MCLTALQRRWSQNCNPGFPLRKWGSPSFNLISNNFSTLCRTLGWQNTNWKYKWGQAWLAPEFFLQSCLPILTSVFSHESRGWQNTIFVSNSYMGPNLVGRLLPAKLSPNRPTCSHAHWTMPMMLAVVIIITRNYYIDEINNKEVINILATCCAELKLV